MSNLNSSTDTSRTVTYRETATLGDILQSRITVTGNAGPDRLFELAFSTTFSQAKNPNEPRVQHRLYVTASEIERIIGVLNDALTQGKQ